MTVKKLPTKPGVRARKRGVAPPSSTRRDEIVEDIHRYLRPLKQKKSAAGVIAEVNQAIDSQIESARKRERVPVLSMLLKNAKMLDLALAKVEALLQSAPGPLIWKIFYPGTPAKTAPREAELVIFKRAEAFSAELKEMRKKCAHAGNTEFGDHPNYDYAKHASAWGAHGLMAELSNAKISGSQGGAFRVIASLLYEAITGEQDVDLKRACDSVLRDLEGNTPPQKKGHTDRYFSDPMYPIEIEDDDKSAN
jgi:hypothetical protein